MIKLTAKELLSLFLYLTRVYKKTFFGVVFFLNQNIPSPLYLTAATLMEKITGPLSTGSLRFPVSIFFLFK